LILPKSNQICPNLNHLCPNFAQICPNFVQICPNFFRKYGCIPSSYATGHSIPIFLTSSIAFDAFPLKDLVEITGCFPLSDRTWTNPPGVITTFVPERRKGLAAKHNHFINNQVFKVCVSKD